MVARSEINLRSGGAHGGPCQISGQRGRKEDQYEP